MFGNRAMYKDGWMALLPRVGPHSLEARRRRHSRGSRPGMWDPDKDRWSSTTSTTISPRPNDLAAEHPEKLAELKKLFWEEAEKYHVLPLLGGLGAVLRARLRHAAERTQFTFYPGDENISAGMIPPVYNRSFTITADLEIPEAGAEGVIVAEADVMGGLLALRAGRQAATTPTASWDPRSNLDRVRKLPAGKVQVRYEFTADKPGKPATGGRGRLFIGDRHVGENQLAHTVPAGSPATRAWISARTTAIRSRPPIVARSPFAFTGKILKLDFDLTPPGTH